MGRHSSEKLLANLCIAVIVAAPQFLVPGIAYAQVCNEPFKRPAYKTRQQHCNPGDLIPDAYTSNQIVLCEDMEVDHLISLFHAWKAGVCGDDLKRLANDPQNLRFTHWRTNRSKGSLSPDEFAATLPEKIARSVRRDAKSLMARYDIPAPPTNLQKRLAALTEELELAKKQLNVAQANLLNHRGRLKPAKQAISETVDSISTRAKNRATRNIASTPAESLPYVGIAVITGVTALEVKDTCDTMQDVHDLSFAFDPELANPDDVSFVCSLVAEVPSTGQLWETVQNSPRDAWNKAIEYVPTLEELENIEVDWAGLWVATKQLSSVTVEHAKSGGKKLWDRAADGMGNAVNGASGLVDGAMDAFGE